MPDGAVVEAPFALFDEQVKVLAGDAVVAPQMPLGLVPEILDSVDVVALIREQLRVVDPQMMELGHIEHIIARQHLDDDSPQNLCLACPHCNLHKGPNLTTLLEPTREVVLLFNPRELSWEEHFRFEGPIIVGYHRPEPRQRIF